MYDFGDEVTEVSGLADFVTAIRKHPVVVAPVTIFQSGRGYHSQAYLLSLFFRWKNLHGHTANAIMGRFRDGQHDRVDVDSERFLGVFELDRVWPYLGVAFKRGHGGGSAGLDDLFADGGITAFENQWAVRNALYRARFVLTGKLMPMIDLLIVDEAHKLKSAESLRTRAMREAFIRRFRKALFLTATPFQLDVSELKEVFSLFAGAKDAPKNLEEQVAELLFAVGEYQRTYDLFQQTWMSMDPVGANKFRELYDQNPDQLDKVEDPALVVLAGQVRALKKLKNEKIEPGFRSWMIRSLREDKRLYRKPLRKTICAGGAGALRGRPGRENPDFLFQDRHPCTIKA